MNHPLEARDKIIAEVRAVREAYAARFDYDVAAIFEHAREKTKRIGRKVVQRQPKPIEKIAETPS